MRISHLSFIDNIIIFINGSVTGLRKFMDFLSRYEHCSSQKVNHSKSSFYISSWVSNGRVEQISTLIGFRKQYPPFIYLGYPIYVGRKRAIYFQTMVDKISSYISSWQNNFLNMGGHLILIEYVLSSIPVHILSAISPPKQVIHELDWIFSKFLWGQHEQEEKRHWMAWTRLCRPFRENGLVITSL